MGRHFSFRPSFTLHGRQFYGPRGWAGKPTHPLLTDFPYAGYILAAAFDVMSLVARYTGYGFAHDAFVASTWVMSGAFLASVLTATTGLLDWPATTRGTQARRTVNAHASIMVTATLIAAGTVVLRWHYWPGPSGTILLITILTVLVALLVATGAWLGNDLIFEHGFRVEPSRNTAAWEPSEEDILPGAQALDRNRWQWASRRNGHQPDGHQPAGVSQLAPVASTSAPASPPGPSLPPAPASDREPPVQTARAKVWPRPAQNLDDTLGKLRELAHLKDEGVITGGEFEAKKKELLGRL